MSPTTRTGVAIPGAVVCPGRTNPSVDRPNRRKDSDVPASHRCGRTWSGLSQAHCPTCCAHFGSVRGFDRHRSTGQCQDPAGIVSRSGRRIFRSADGPLGVTWVLDTDRVHPGQARRLAAEEDAA